MSRENTEERLCCVEWGFKLRIFSRIFFVIIYSILKVKNAGGVRNYMDEM